MNVLTRSGMIFYSISFGHPPLSYCGDSGNGGRGGNGGSDDFDRTNVTDVVDNIDRATYIGFHT